MNIELKDIKDDDRFLSLYKKLLLKEELSDEEKFKLLQIAMHPWVILSVK